MGNLPMLKRLGMAGAALAGDVHVRGTGGRAQAGLRKRLGWAGAALAGRVAVRGGFSGASTGRLMGDWDATAQAPDDLARWKAPLLRDRAQDLERNSGLARHFLRMLGINVVGPCGAHLRPLIRDNSGNLNTRLNAKMRDAWSQWTHRCTLDGKMGWGAFQRLLLRCVARDGEALVRHWRADDGNRFRYSVEYVDPALLDYDYNAVLRNGNEIRMGVEVDEKGRPQAYHLWNRLQSSVSYGAARKRERIPADQIIHLYDPERGNQTRGITWLASVMMPIRQLEGYREAALISERMSASKMVFFQRKQGEGAGTLVEGEDGKLEMDFAPGTSMVLPDGYEVASFDPNSPGAIFGQFVKDNIRGIAVGLGISYNSAASDLEGVNYSSIRSGMLADRDLWKVVQAWWESALLRPIFTEWLNMALLSGELVLDTRDPGKLGAHTWRHRGWQWVDPLKDTQAAVLGIGWGLASRTRALGEQGESFEDVLEELAEEKAMAAEYGVEITVAPLPGNGVPADKSDPEDDPDAEDAADKKDEKAAPAPRTRHGVNGHSPHNGMATLPRRR